MTDVRRYLVPYFDTSPDVATASHYREAEFEQIEALFEQAVSARRPGIVVAGRG